MRLHVQRERLPERWTADEGLTPAEVTARRQKFGANDVLEKRPPGWRELVHDTVRDPMIAFMVATSAIYFVLGDTVEGWVLLASTVPLVGMDAFLHRRAQASLESLRQQLAATARVWREGTWSEIPAREVVVGDLVQVRAGESVPADGLVVRADAAQAEESALTGESFPVRKHALDGLPSSEPVDGEHWALAGTRLLTGSVQVRILAVGPETLYGGIARSAGRNHGHTPLQAAVNRLVGALVFAALVFCVLLAVVRLRQGFGWVDAAISAATLGVAALPEEFPVALTFFLGVGVVRLARRKAMVRRAVSVENIGRITCVCSDKTGTLTEGKLRAVEWIPVDGTASQRLIEIAALASRPETGDPLDVALVETAAHEGARPSLTPVATFPFTEQRKRETAVLRSGAAYFAASKGAPERIFDLCSLDDATRAWAHAQVATQANQARKVIALAQRTLDAQWDGTEPVGGFEFLGLVALEDPVREGVVDAVRLLSEAGLRTILITGDHPDTARAVARTLGIGGPDGPQIVTGEALADATRAPRVDGIARALPQDKLRLIELLQAEGERVAVTGDGVNDVPALQAADVGVAMGERGTRSSKDAAAIVLLDDNFRTLVGAIAEGRQLFSNLRESFAYLLLIHTPLVLTAALIPLSGQPLLYLPIHVVWLELILHPTAMLAFQAPARADRLERLPRSTKTRFFTGPEWIAIGLSGAMSFGLIVFGYWRSLGPGGGAPHGRALVMLFLVLTSAISSSLLSGWRTRAAWIIPLTAVTLSAVLLESPLSRVLFLQPPHLDDWLYALGGALIAAIPVAVWRRPRRERLTSAGTGFAPPAALRARRAEG